MADYWSSTSATLPVLAPQPSHPSDSASSGAPPPFHYENLNASSSAGVWPTVTIQQFMDHVQGQGVAARRNQQNGTSSYENTQLQLGRRLSEEIFDEVKELTHSDVNCGQSRLLLPKHFVENHILGSMHRSAADQCRHNEGLPIKVWDMDESREYGLPLKQWPSTDSYVLTGSWIPEFVTRKGLEKGDRVGLTYPDSTLSISGITTRLN